MPTGIQEFRVGDVGHHRNAEAYGYSPLNCQRICMSVNKLRVYFYYHLQER